MLVSGGPVKPVRGLRSTSPSFRQRAAQQRHDERMAEGLAALRAAQPTAGLFVVSKEYSGSVSTSGKAPAGLLKSVAAHRNQRTIDVENQRRSAAWVRAMLHGASTAGLELPYRPETPPTAASDKGLRSVAPQYRAKMARDAQTQRRLEALAHVQAAFAVPSMASALEQAKLHLQATLAGMLGSGGTK